MASAVRAVLALSEKRALPSSLAKPPLEEAVFELRFTPKAGASIVSLLPGVIFAKLGHEYSRAEALPLASLPEGMRKADPALRYHQQLRVSGDKASVFIGDAVAGVSQLAPYEGWSSFSERIRSLLKILSDSELIGRVERFSLKTINLLEAPAEARLALTRIQLMIAGYSVPERGSAIRFELNDDSYLRIVELSAGAEMKTSNGETKQGLLLSLDCICQAPVNFWKSSDHQVDELHNAIKVLFFSLLNDDTISALGPRYQVRK